MKKEIIKDLPYEKAVTEYLKRATKKIQRVLDTWNALELESCSSTPALYDLIWNPEIAFTQGCKLKQVPPPGLTKSEGEKHTKNIKANLPLPGPFFKAAEQCRFDPYCKREKSYFVMKGGEIATGPSADELKKARSVYAENKGQEDFINSLVDWIQEGNRINKLCGGKLFGQRFSEMAHVWDSVIQVPGKDVPGFNEISVDRGKLTKIIAHL
jgi:hypothetical protein